MRAGLVALVAGGALAGCGLDYASTCSSIDVRAGDSVECTMPGYTDRAFDLRVPAGWDGNSPLPLIVALHGGAAFAMSPSMVS